MNMSMSKNLHECFGVKVYTAVCMIGKTLLDDSLNVLNNHINVSTTHLPKNDPK